MKAKAARSWGLVQQRHSQLQCGNTVNLMLSLLQSILVPALHYGCEIWGMHTPTGEAKAARAALQSICDRFLRHICGVKHAPSAVLLEELALSPLQVFWWQQTLEFWNTIAASPVGSIFHTIVIDNVHDAFHVGRGAKNFSSFIAICLQSVGHSLPRDSGVVPIMEVAAVIAALREHLGGTHSHALHCPRAAPSAGVVSCTYHHGLDLLASVDDTVSCLFLAGVRNAFHSSGLLLTTCLLLLVGFPGTNMLQELTGCAHTVVASLLPMSYTWFMNVQFFSHLGYNMLLSLPQTLTL